jgi:hypothetical protein
MKAHGTPHHPSHTIMSERFDSSTHLSPTEATTQSLKVDDNARLRMLGYDAVLGRSFGFWSTAGISLAYMCPVDEIVLLCTIYAYAAPLVFVCLVECVLAG